MKRLYKLCDLEKIVLERLKEKGFKFIYRDSLEFSLLVASIERPYFNEDMNFLETINSDFCFVGFEIFFPFIKVPDFYKIDDLLSIGHVIYED